MNNIKTIFGKTIQAGDTIRFNADGHLEVSKGGESTFERAPQAETALLNYIATKIDYPFRKNEAGLALFTLSNKIPTNWHAEITAENWANYFETLTSENIDHLIDSGRNVQQGNLNEAIKATATPFPARLSKVIPAPKHTPTPTASEPTEKPRKPWGTIGFITASSLGGIYHAYNRSRVDEPPQPAPPSHVQSLEAELLDDSPPSRSR